MDENVPDGKITPLVKIGVDESGRTIVQASKDLQVDSTLLARIVETWGAFYLEANKMPDPPPPDEEESVGPLVCPKCGQQAVNPTTGQCNNCGYALIGPPQIDRKKWWPDLVHCRECGREIQIKSEPDEHKITCVCGHAIYIGPNRRKKNGS